MARPLMQLGIMDLESLFAKSRRDMQVLSDMELELRHRQVPRARRLLHQVRIAMKAAAGTVQSTVLQPEAIGDPVIIPIQSELEIFNQARSISREIKPAVLVEEKTGSQAREEDPVVLISEAYKVLKVNPGASWESIELARRQLVQRASPSLVVGEQRLRLQQDAERINAAYRVIALDKIGYR